MTVRGERIELERGSDIVLGRALACDVVAEDVMCSRRHAQISVGKTIKSHYVVDLDSRNGTFLNEKRIEGRVRIEQGARIRIGSTVFLFTATDSTDTEDGAGDFHDTGTVSFDAYVVETSERKLEGLVQSLGNLSSEFAGQISQDTLIDVLQLLTQTNRNGTLNVVTESGPATVHLRLGEVHHTEYEGQAGFDALSLLAREKTGIFWFEASTDRCKRTIKKPTANLLLELCHMIDETARR